MDFNILSVVSPESFESGKEIYSFFREERFEYIQFIPQIPVDGETPADPQKYGVFLSDVFDGFYEDFKNGRVIYIRNFENVLGSIMGLCPEACEFMDHCVDNIAIEADGSVYPCDFYMTDKYLLGNVNVNSSLELKDSSIKKEFLKSSFNIPDECTACPYFKLCRGGCRRYRDINITHHYYCEGFKYFFERNLDKLKEIADLMQKGR